MLLMGKREKRDVDDDRKLLEASAAIMDYVCGNFYHEDSPSDEDWEDMGFMWTDEYDCNQDWNPLWDEGQAMMLLIKIGGALVEVLESRGVTYVSGYMGEIAVVESHNQYVEGRHNITLGTLKAIVRYAVKYHSMEDKQ